MRAVRSHHSSDSQDQKLLILLSNSCKGRTMWDRKQYQCLDDISSMLPDGPQRHRPASSRHLSKDRALAAFRKRDNCMHSHPNSVRSDLDDGSIKQTLANHHCHDKTFATRNKGTPYSPETLLLSGSAVSSTILSAQHYCLPYAKRSSKKRPWFF